MADRFAPPAPNVRATRDQLVEIRNELRRSHTAAKLAAAETNPAMVRQLAKISEQASADALRLLGLLVS